MNVSLAAVLLATIHSLNPIKQTPSREYSKELNRSPPHYLPSLISTASFGPLPANMSSLSYACVTLALICTILPTPGSCTSFEVEAGQTFSIYLTDVKEGESIGLRYQVLHGGMMDIDVVV